MKYLCFLILFHSGVSFANENWTPLSFEHYFNDWQIFIEKTDVPFNCKGDFDGDGTLDTAWLAFDSKKRIRVAVRLSSKKEKFLLPEATFSQYLGTRDGYDKEGSWFALETIKLEKIKKAQYEAMKGMTTLNSDAITIIKFESSAQAVYWVTGEQKSIWLGD